MADRDRFAERGRALEDEYFRKKDQELIDRLRRAAASDRARHDLEERTGLHDPEMLNELQSLGFTPDTLTLLPLVPLVQVAWSEGGVSNAERSQILSLARSRGIAGSTRPVAAAGASTRSTPSRCPSPRSTAGQAPN